MKRSLPALIFLSLSVPSFAGYAGYLAPAHKFRILLEGRAVHREVSGQRYGIPGKDTVSVSYPLLRFQYGLSSRFRVSGDGFLFRGIADNDLGGRALESFSLIGLSLQGEVCRIRPDMPLDATMGYWETHIFQYEFNFPNSVRIERMASLTIAREFDRNPANRLYVGGLYSHLRREGFGYDVAYSSGMASRHDFGAVAGLDYRVNRHIVLEGEAFWTGDYTLSGGVGWEF
jgi:hypothetical protein